MKKLLLEINRYKQLMNIVLLTESGKVVDEFLPIGAKSVDNLTKQGVDFANDLSKLSDEFTNRGIKTFDDLTAVVASKNPTIDPKNITDDMIKAYIKSDDKLYNSILAKSAAAATVEADILVKSVDLKKIFSNNIEQLNAYNTYLSYAPSIRNIDTLIQGVDDSIAELNKTIDEIQTGKVPGVTTVPKDLEELYEQLLGKKVELTEYKNKDVSPAKVVDDLSSVKWGNLGNGFTISNKITNYGGRYTVMVKDANGRLRPFYQRTGGGTRAGDPDEGWAAKGNWVPFYGIADVSFYRIINEETQEWGWKRTKGWMIKPENGRQGEEGDEAISKLLADVAGTNGIKDVDYGFGNLYKSMTNTESTSGMNTWLRSFGYEITPENGYLKVANPNRVIVNGIP
jgi:hypothetical protein